MMYLSTQLSNIPLLNIRSGGRIGTAISPIINPNNLHIDGFYCTTIYSSTTQILLDMHIRDLSGRGIIIDDHNYLSEPDELVRLQPILDIGFELINKRALVNKKRVGKIVEYTVHKESLFIEKLYVKPSLIISLQQDRLTFDRNNIIEVTDSYVAFGGPEVKATNPATAQQPA